MNGANTALTTPMKRNLRFNLVKKPSVHGQIPDGISSFLQLNLPRGVFLLQQTLPHSPASIKQVSHQAIPQIPLQCPRQGVASIQVTAKKPIQDGRQRYPQIQNVFVK